MNFKEKVQSMTAKEIILAMVASLKRPPIVNIDMNTYGDARQKRFLGIPYGKEVCFGCAATNTVCQIAGKKFTTYYINSPVTRASFLETDWRFLDAFESAINQLRLGDIGSYNRYANSYKFALINLPFNMGLPKLTNLYTNRQLRKYTKLANAQ